MNKTFKSMIEPNFRREMLSNSSSAKNKHSGSIQFVEDAIEGTNFKML